MLVVLGETSALFLLPLAFWFIEEKSMQRKALHTWQKFYLIFKYLSLIPYHTPLLLWINNPSIYRSWKWHASSSVWLFVVVNELLALCLKTIMKIRLVVTAYIGGMTCVPPPLLPPTFSVKYSPPTPHASCFPPTSGYSCDEAGPQGAHQWYL